MSAQIKPLKRQINFTGGVLNLKKILHHLPLKTSLYYINYDDNLDGNFQEIQDCLQSGNMDSLYETIDNLLVDDMSGFNYVIKELKSDLENYWTEEVVEMAMEKYEDEIRDAIYERDESTPMDDLIRNTRDIVMFYDTGYEVEDNSWAWGKAKLRLERYLLKKHLGIVHTTKYDERIEELLENASYGGQLVVYFNDNFKNYIVTEDKDFNTISFENAHIAIIHTGNGSGFDTELNGLTFSLPFNKERFFVDKTIKYNYTYCVCGMSSDWCSDTIVSFSKVEGEIKELPVSDLAAIQTRDKAFAAKWNKGKGECSFGDMDIRRHKNTPYTNDYPCGNTCTSCGTFWID